MEQTTTLTEIARQLEKAMTPKLAPDCMNIPTLRSRVSGV